MSDKLNIEQLVSTKFAEAEITPSRDAWKGIQRKLRWRQFMRFNPAQFNVYYLAGLMLVATGLVTVLLLKRTEVVSLEPVQNVPESVFENVPEEQAEDKSGTQVESSDKRTSFSTEATMSADEEAFSDELTGQESPPSGKKSALQGENKEEDGEDRKILPVAKPVESPAETLIENHTFPTLLCSFSSSVQSGCVPLEVQFLNQSENTSIYEWSFGMEGQSSSSNPVYLFEEPGNFTVTLRIKDQTGQTAISQQTIEVYPVPTAEFDIEEGFEGVDGHVSMNLLNYSTGANNYSWNLEKKNDSACKHWNSDEYQPALKLTDIRNGAEKIRLIATNENGCGDTVTAVLPLMVESSDVKIKFATAFSPNPTGPGDGTFSPGEKRIDLFHPVYLEVPVEYHLVVYTKRGEIVFETRDAYQGWDGYFHEERSAGGVYVWMLEGTWINGESFKLQGDVTLIWQDIW